MFSFMSTEIRRWIGRRDDITAQRERVEVGPSRRSLSLFLFFSLFFYFSFFFLFSGTPIVRQSLLQTLFTSLFVPSRSFPFFFSSYPPLTYIFVFLYFLTANMNNDRGETQTYGIAILLLPCGSRQYLIPLCYNTISHCWRRCLYLHPDRYAKQITGRSGYSLAYRGDRYVSKHIIPRHACRIVRWGVRLFDYISEIAIDGTESREQHRR